MANKFNVSLEKIIQNFNLEVIYMPKDASEILIDENDVTRPGLQLMGFYEYFNPGKCSLLICLPLMKQHGISVWICCCHSTFRH